MALADAGPVLRRRAPFVPGALGAEPEGEGGDLSGTGIDIDAVKVVLDDEAWDESAEVRQGFFFGVFFTGDVVRLIATKGIGGHQALVEEGVPIRPGQPPDEGDARPSFDFFRAVKVKSTRWVERPGRLYDQHGRLAGEWLPHGITGQPVPVSNRDAVGLDPTCGKLVPE